jgi:hypothetical protein
MHEARSAFADEQPQETGLMMAVTMPTGFHRRQDRA